jgi:hypothetical protein
MLLSEKSRGAALGVLNLDFLEDDLRFIKDKIEDDAVTE